MYYLLSYCKKCLFTALNDRSISWSGNERNASEGRPRPKSRIYLANDYGDDALTVSFTTMFSLARTALRPSLARAFLAPSASASLHTLPELPYAYDVQVFVVLSV